MILKPYSYNGTLLNSTDYVTGFPQQQANTQIMSNPGYIKRAGAVPVFAGKDYSPHVLNLEILAQVNFMEQIEDINQLFDTKDETPRQFICTDNGDTDSQWYVYATAKEVRGGHEGPMIVVTLALDDPIWQNVTQTTHTWSVTSSTSTTDVTIAGNDESYPVFEITPTSQPSTDFIYHRYVQIVPRSLNPWNARPICITGDVGAFDTAALVTAGKMTTDGDDIRIQRDGQDVDFWVSNFNTTDTRIWVVADMPPKYHGILKTAIGATDTVTEIEYVYNTTTKNVLTAMPASGYLVVDTAIGSTDSEVFTYTRKTITDTKLAVTISARGVKDSGAFAHGANVSNVRHMPHSYTILYGNASAEAAEVSDTRKPLLNMSTSTNSSFVYSNFSSLSGLRAGGWFRGGLQVSSSARTRSGFYTSTNDEGDTDPATALGIKAQSYVELGVWKPDTVNIYWGGAFTDGVSSVVASGTQTQSVAVTPTFFLQKSVGTGLPGETIWAVALQSSSDWGTWTSWSKPSSDAPIPPDTNYLRLSMVGNIYGTADHYRKVSVEALTVTLTNPVHVLMQPETSNGVSFRATIRNTTTGDSFQINYPLQVSDTLIIDTDPDFPTAKHNGVIVNGAIKLSSIRSRWLRLVPGSNTLGFDNLAGASSNVTINVKWRNRMNFF